MALFKKFKEKENKNKKTENKIVGDLRQGQLISTYGIGSIVDFVDNTVIIAGTDDWIDKENLRLFNEGLQSLTGANYFLMPKPSDNTVWAKSRDIPAYIFPDVLYCPKCKHLYKSKDAKIYKGAFKCLNCNKNLVASRFVLACENGHMQDFPYYWWVHRGQECEAGEKKHNLVMYNVNDRADIDSLVVQCEDCKAIRGIRDALADSHMSGFRCRGYHPHLAKPRYFCNDGCNANMKTRLRLSNGLYFPVIQSALTIPPWSKKATQIIMRRYKEISHAVDPVEFIKDCILPDNKRLTLEALVSAYNRVVAYKAEHKQETMKNIMFDEYFALSQGTVQNEDDYEAREVSVPLKYSHIIDEIVAVDKLTVISALCGFTRLKPWSGTSLNDQRIVPLSMEKKKWLPGMRMTGEGLFIRFNIEKLQEWESAIESRYNKMRTAYEKSFICEQRFSSRFVFLHTFSHMLIRQLSAECGYSATSLKERIYSTYVDDDLNDMAGVLIYLASSDSDGSLGGLINVTDDSVLFENILDEMLREALWCSGDPICINSEEQGIDSLNYSACHDCALLPEVSCECRNVFLDRVSVVGKPDDRSMGLLGIIAESVSQ